MLLAKHAAIFAYTLLIRTMVILPCCVADALAHKLEVFDADARASARAAHVSDRARRLKDAGDATLHALGIAHGAMLIVGSALAVLGPAAGRDLGFTSASRISPRRGKTLPGGRRPLGDVRSFRGRGARGVSIRRVVSATRLGRALGAVRTRRRGGHLGRAARVRWVDEAAAKALGEAGDAALCCAARKSGCGWVGARAVPLPSPAHIAAGRSSHYYSVAASTYR